MASEEPTAKRSKSDAGKKWYVQRFNKKWLADPVFKRWLIEVENEEGSSSAKCKFCDCLFKNTNRAALYKHVTTVKHKARMHGTKRRLNSKVIGSPKTKNVSRDLLLDIEKLVAVSELKLAGYMAEHCLPFNQAEQLSLLLPSLCPDSILPRGMEVMTSTKVSCIIQQGIAFREREELVQILKNQKFSIIVDEATRQSVPQILAVAVRYFDETIFESVDRLLGIIEVEEATAAGVINAIKSLMDQHKISMSNIIGLATDNCSSMMSSESGFQALMTQDIPGLFVMGCICHSIALCANNASKCLPSWVETLLCDIEAYLLQTSKRMFELQMIVETLKNPHDKVLKLSTVRRTSRSGVIACILEHYEALKLFFESEQSENSQNNNDQKEKAMEIHKTLTTAGTEHMLLFLNYILEKVDNMNKQFQAEGDFIYNIHGTMKNSFFDILRHFINEDAIQGAKYDTDRIDLSDDSIGIRKQLKDVILGEKCTQKLINESLGEKESSFRQDALNFLIQLSVQVGSVFDIGDHSTLALMRYCVYPAVAVDFTDERPVSLMPLAMKLPAILGDKNADTLDDQWLRLPFVKDSLEEAMHPVPISECAPGAFWKTVKNFKDSEEESIFRDLGQFMCDILALPLSSAAVESILSEVNTIKVTITNKLHVTTLENRILAMQHIKKNGGCHLWKPHHSLVKAVMNEVCYQRYETFLRENEEEELNVPYDTYK